jgi:hypothetical protein
MPCFFLMPWWFLQYSRNAAWKHTLFAVSSRYFCADHIPWWFEAPMFIGYPWYSTMASGEIKHGHEHGKIIERLWNFNWTCVITRYVDMSLHHFNMCASCIPIFVNAQVLHFTTWPSNQASFCWFRSSDPSYVCWKRSRFLSEQGPWNLAAGGTSIDLQRSRQGGTLPPSWLFMGIVALECIGFMCHFVWQDRYHGELGFN